MNNFYIQTGSFRVPTCSDEILITQTYVEESEEIVSERVKNEISDWVKSLKILKWPDENISEAFSDGVLFLKILNKFETPTSQIKFFQKQPLKNTEKRLNVNKLLGHLRKTPKFVSESLFKEKDIISGNNFVVWSLLSDLKSYYSLSKVVIPSKIPLMNKSFLQFKSKSYISHESFSVFSNVFPVSQSKITQKHIAKVCVWLNKIGLGECIHEKDSHFLQNPFRNGLLLTEILRKFKFNITNQIEIFSIEAITSQINECISIIQQIPGCFTENLNALSIIQGNEEVIWGLLYSLSMLFPELPKETTKLYNNYQRKDLTHSLSIWINGFSVVPEVNEWNLFGKMRDPQILNCFLTRIFPEFLSTCNTVFDILQRKLRYKEILEKDIAVDDILLLVLENLHRLYDKVELNMDRDWSFPIYTGKGYRKY